MSGRTHIYPVSNGDQFEVSVEDGSGREVFGVLTRAQLETAYSAGDRLHESVTATADIRPHSRACGFRHHDHGAACAPDCPTCYGLGVKFTGGADAHSANRKRPEDTPRERKEEIT